MRPVIVLGMHRSGTSLVTRLVNLLGVPLGPVEDLYVGKHNPSGYWESVTLIDANDRILASRGGSWRNPPELPEGWQYGRQPNQLLPMMKSAFDSVYPAEPWLWKDPRTCLTLPLWRRLLDARDPVVVFVSRHPSGVADSLYNREQMPERVAVALWERYNRRAIFNSTGMSVATVRFEHIVSDPSSEVARLKKDLETLGVNAPNGIAACLNYVSHRRPQLSPVDLSEQQERLLSLIETLPACSSSLGSVNLGEETPSTSLILRRSKMEVLQRQTRRLKRWFLGALPRHLLHRW